MTLRELREATGVTGMRELRDRTIIEFDHGSARPATDLELKLWRILTTGRA